MTVELRKGERAEELTPDGLKIVQSDALYRFTSDAVLLTRFASAKRKEKVADFCSGSGVVGLHYYALHRECVAEAHLFEIQPELAEMSRRSVELNGLGGIFRVHAGPLQEIGREFDGYFSLVLCNPPYEKAGSGETSLSESDRIARHEVAITLEEVIGTAAAKLKYGGRLCIAHRADRLVDVVCLLRRYGLEPKRIRFAVSGEKAPYLVFAEGVKGGKPSLIIESPFINKAPISRKNEG